MKLTLTALTINAWMTGLTLFGQIPSTARQSNAYTLDSGLAFRLPDGWQMQVSGQAATLAPAGMVQGSEVYYVGIMLGMRDVNDPKLIPSLVAANIPANLQARQEGTPSAFQAESGRGVYHRYSVSDGAAPYLFEFYLVGLRDGRVASLIVGGKRELLNSRRDEIFSIATSFNTRSATIIQPTQYPSSAPASVSNSSLVNTWMQRLNDKKLVQMSSYSSGSSGGYSSERKLYLASDGSYAYRSSSSVSVYVPGANGGSSGSNADQGRWRVIEQDGKAILELASAKGTRENIFLSMNGTKTLLNGRQWFRVGINE